MPGRVLAGGYMLVRAAMILLLSWVLAAFFWHLTGVSLADYARQELLSPMGITLEEEDWSQWPFPDDNNAYTFGGGLSRYRTRDLARIGLLTLYNGQWDGQQLVSPEWLALSTAPIGEGAVVRFDGAGVPSLSTEDIRYGMQWWTRTGPSFSGPDALTARGLGGQYILVFPEQALVVVATHHFSESDTPVDRTTGLVAFLQSQVIDQLVVP